MEISTVPLTENPSQSNLCFLIHFPFLDYAKYGQIIEQRVELRQWRGNPLKTMLIIHIWIQEKELCFIKIRRGLKREKPK